MRNTFKFSERRISFVLSLIVVSAAMAGAEVRIAVEPVIDFISASFRSNMSWCDGFNMGGKELMDDMAVGYGSRCVCCA